MWIPQWILEFLEMQPAFFRCLPTSPVPINVVGNVKHNHVLADFLKLIAHICHTLGELYNLYKQRNLFWFKILLHTA